ncbi:hypothetical protein LBMAG49_25290 [Planctomycetota bacterium]|nr:hypothetical protein [Planctomycetota bacterium]GDY03200.1 hypothetical protein LBMAG49_25290 [Planctomycetota bacterium]
MSMPLSRPRQSWLAVLMSGLACLVLASGIGRALIKCTDSCGESHLTTHHYGGECGHASLHGLEHGSAIADTTAAGATAADPLASDLAGPGRCKDTMLISAAAALLRADKGNLPPLSKAPSLLRTKQDYAEQQHWISVLPYPSRIEIGKAMRSRIVLRI